MGVELPRRAGLEAMVLPAILRTGAAESLSKGYYGAPKPVPITGLQVLLQRGALRRAGLEAMMLPAMLRVKVGSGGREQHGAWREGTHDGLVFAVALACWAARKMYPGEPAGEEAYWRFKGWRDCEREFRRGMERRREGQATLGAGGTLPRPAFGAHERPKSL